MSMKKNDWAEFAALCAMHAHENWFSSRRGQWYFEDLDVVVIYNNNPYKGHPTLRDEELAEFRERLRAKGITELAYATYPVCGYSYAMVINAGRDQEQFLDDLRLEITLKTMGRIPPNSPGAG